MSETIIRLDDGSEVATGLLMPTTQEIALLAALPMFDQNLMLDDKQIEARLRKNAVDVYKEKRKKRQKRMRNQGGLGKCNASSNTAAMENNRENQGMPHVALSDCFGYACVNGGRDAGSGLYRTFDSYQTVGCSPMQVQVGGVTKTLPNNFYNFNQIDKALYAQAKIEAKRFVGWEFYKLPIDDFATFCRAAASAIALDMQIIWAWHVGAAGSRITNGYMNLGGGPGNHSNCIHSGKWRGGKTLVDPDNQNSWGPSVDPLYGNVGGNGWGEGGFALTTMEGLYSCVRNHGIYVQTSVAIDPTDPAFQGIAT